MLDAAWTVHETGDVVLVEAVVENTAAVARNVGVQPVVEGPVMPPRRRGVPESGWDDGDVQTVVPAHDRLAVGFATTGDPADPPVEVVDSGRASQGPSEDRADGPSPTDVLRDLGSPAPPRDAVPRNEAPDGRPADAPTERPAQVPTEPSAGPTSTRVPGAVASWLDEVAARMLRSERPERAVAADVAALRAVADRAATLAAADEEYDDESPGTRRWQS